MRSNYKKLGKYIQPVNIRNTELKVDTLLGVSIQKVLMPSIANTVGTNMKTYKIIKRNQFAYGPVTSRNGDKISVALLQDYDEAIVSQAYTVFEVKDENELHPEYLMMWMRRPEFDRYARFKSHGSAREVFDWDEMCETELPIPTIEKQHEIVKEYNTIVNRIKLNDQLNRKLEETAQALYKHWFVDFEFPNADGKPYKSAGGKMVYNMELDRQIPEGWETKELLSLTRLLKRGITPKYKEDFGEVVINQKCIRNNTINYSLSRFHNTALKAIPEEKKVLRWDILVNSTGTGTLGRVGLVKKLHTVTTVDTHVTIVRNNNLINTFYLWGVLSNNTKHIEELGEGSTGQTELSRNNLGEMKILVCDMNIQLAFEKKFKPLIEHSVSIEDYEEHLLELRNLLLSKITRTQN